MSGVVQYNPVLWTMHVEFIGSLMILGWLAIWGKARYRMIWWALVCIMLIFYNPCYLPMVVGVISADLYMNWHLKSNRLVIILSLLTVIFFGGMPFSNNLFGIYSYLPRWNLWIYYAIAVPCILAVVMRIKYFSTPVLEWLGKYSFSIYLFHFLVQCFITEGFYLRIVYKIPFYFVTLILTLCFHMLAVIIVAVIYTETIGKWWGNFVKATISTLCV